MLSPRRSTPSSKPNYTETPRCSLNTAVTGKVSTTSKLRPVRGWPGSTKIDTTANSTTELRARSKRTTVSELRPKRLERAETFCLYKTQSDSDKRGINAESSRQRKH